MLYLLPQAPLPTDFGWLVDGRHWQKLREWELGLKQSLSPSLLRGGIFQQWLHLLCGPNFSQVPSFRVLVTPRPPALGVQWPVAVTHL